MAEKKFVTTPIRVSMPTNITPRPMTPAHLQSPVGLSQQKEKLNIQMGSQQYSGSMGAGPAPTPNMTPMQPAPGSSTGLHTQNSKHGANYNALDQTLTRKNLQELTRAVDPNEQLDEDVEEYLLNYAEGYMEELIEGACQLAAHRKGNTVDCKDVQTHLERSCNVWIPGFGADEVKPFKRAPVTEAHKQRMALIKKTVKKY